MDSSRIASSSQTNISSRIPGQRVAKKAQESVQDLNQALASQALNLQLKSGKHLLLPNYIPYTIQPGDNLTSIAQRQLGPQASAQQVEKYINQILDLNEDIIENPHQLYQGDVIAIPVVPIQGKSQAQHKFLD